METNRVEMNAGERDEAHRATANHIATIFVASGLQIIYAGGMGSYFSNNIIPGETDIDLFLIAQNAPMPNRGRFPRFKVEPDINVQKIGWEFLIEERITSPKIPSLTGFSTNIMSVPRALYHLANLEVLLKSKEEFRKRTKITLGLTGESLILNREAMIQGSMWVFNGLTGVNLFGELTPRLQREVGKVQKLYDQMNSRYRSELGRDFPKKNPIPYQPDYLTVRGYLNAIMTQF
jgi:hypothetical protein